MKTFYVLKPLGSFLLYVLEIFLKFVIYAFRDNFPVL